MALYAFLEIQEDPVKICLFEVGWLLCQFSLNCGHSGASASQESVDIVMGGDHIHSRVDHDLNYLPTWL